MRPDMSATDDFNTELLKLLLQIAWADGELDERERNLIHGLGRSWLVPEDTLKHLMDRLAQGQPLPPPHLPVLKGRLDEVMEAARALVAADGRTDEQETEMLEQIQALLS